MSGKEESSEGARKAGEEDPLVIDESNLSAASTRNESEDDEKDFEPSVDMMVNDFDDERTLDEEEAQDQQDAKDEVSALEAEGDIPLEELLKMYGYDASKKNEGAKVDESVANESSGSDTNSPNKSGAPAPPLPPSDTPPAKKARSSLAKVYEGEGDSSRALRSANEENNEDEEEDNDDDNDAKEDDENRDYSWKKTIMIGPSFQASVPGDLSPYEGSVLPYENEDKLLWDPSAITEQECERFLTKCQELVLRAAGVNGLPLGAHIRDDEQALHLLLQCGYNSDEALRRLSLNPLPQVESMSLWSEEECRAFELGLRLYGKDFHMIQQQKVRTRSVGELVQFYYLWKKTERHDVFANATRLEKKKYTLHPGTTDYMDRFIDEQDVSRDRASPPNYHSLLFGPSHTTKPGCTEADMVFSLANSYNGAAPNGDFFNVTTSNETIATTSAVTETRTSQLFPAENHPVQDHGPEGGNVVSDT